MVFNFLKLGKQGKNYFFKNQLHAYPTTINELKRITKNGCCLQKLKVGNISN